MNLETLETPRLIGRRLRPGDFELLRQLFQDAQVAVTLGPRTDVEVQEILNRNLQNWNSHGFDLWMFYGRPDERFVGRGGLRKVVIDGRDEVEVGYALLPEFWGQGLATEIATASVRVAFTQLDLPELVSFTLPTNLVSRRVMEKCGFTFERDIIWKDLPHVLYRLKR